MRIADTRAGRTALGAAAARGVRHMAHRFIVGETPHGGARGAPRPVGARRGQLGRPARRGDGHHAPRPTATPQRCDAALRGARRPLRDAGPSGRCSSTTAAGRCPRANVSVKVSALTPLLRPDAPERGREDAAAGCGRCCAARTSSTPTCTSTWSRSTRARPCSSSCSSCSPRRSSATGPSAGVVLQAYLRDSPEQLDRVLDWARSAAAHAAADRPARQGRLLGPRARRRPRQHGWPAPVFEVKADCDRNFEALTRRLLDGAAGGARGDRLAQPALGRRTRSPSTGCRAATTATSSCRCCAASATSSRMRWPPRGLPRAHLLPGRRPRRRDGLPGAPAAREHEQRVVPVTSRPAGSPLEELLAAP